MQKMDVIMCGVDLEGLKGGGKRYFCGRKSNSVSSFRMHTAVNGLEQSFQSCQTSEHLGSGRGARDP